ncbi:Alkaline ceramidase 3 [Sciurus carolinensis]|uniref:Alkaline ceramidase n=1 Tax=Sciurus carolinensis TaxID=30640 RepID=A0AA41N711_SCICA|nr:Alkaline ceramidase 3 [Sciurus carolinensis]
MAPAADREGYWGPTTSTLDWCEENYFVTQYIAEFLVGMGSWCFHMTLQYEMQVMYGMLVFTLVLRSIYIVTWDFRKEVPPILGVTTQFHAWWHILTGLGSYLHILFR